MVIEASNYEDPIAMLDDVIDTLDSGEDVVISFLNGPTWVTLALLDLGFLFPRERITIAFFDYPTVLRVCAAVAQARKDVGPDTSFAVYCRARHILLQPPPRKLLTKREAGMIDRTYIRGSWLLDSHCGTYVDPDSD